MYEAALDGGGREGNGDAPPWSRCGRTPSRLVCAVWPMKRSMPVLLLLALALATLVAPAEATAALRTPGAHAGAPARWVPPARPTWQWQLDGRLDTSVRRRRSTTSTCSTTTRATVAALHAPGRRVVCYMSAGSLERGRPDVARFPRAVVGRTLDGWPGERWLDVRRLDVLGPMDRAPARPVPREGLRRASRPTTSTPTRTRSGFPLTAADQLRFNRFLARAAHARGLVDRAQERPRPGRRARAGLRLGVDEQCFQYDECDRLRAVRRRGQGGLRRPSTACARRASARGPTPPASWRCASAWSSARGAGPAGERRRALARARARAATRAVEPVARSRASAPASR